MTDDQHTLRVILRDIVTTLADMPFTAAGMTGQRSTGIKRTGHGDINAGAVDPEVSSEYGTVRDVLAGWARILIEEAQDELLIKSNRRDAGEAPLGPIDQGETIRLSNLTTTAAGPWRLHGPEVAVTSLDIATWLLGHWRTLATHPAAEQIHAELDATRWTLRAIISAAPDDGLRRAMESAHAAGRDPLATWMPVGLAHEVARRAGAHVSSRTVWRWAERGQIRTRVDMDPPDVLHVLPWSIVEEAAR